MKYQTRVTINKKYCFLFLRYIENISYITKKRYEWTYARNEVVVRSFCTSAQHGSMALQTYWRSHKTNCNFICICIQLCFLETQLSRRLNIEGNYSVLDIYAFQGWQRQELSICQDLGTYLSLHQSFLIAIIYNLYLQNFQIVLFIFRIDLRIVSCLKF